jgi:hypothetical protein
MDSSQIGLLARVAELARRNGLRPSEAAAELQTVFESDDDMGLEVLKLQNTPTDPEKLERHDKVCSLLGCDDNGVLTTKSFDQMEDIVERAIAKSPRSRSP